MKYIAIVLVASIFIFGCSSNSNNGGGSSTTVIPVAPTSLSGVVLSNSSISLSWVDNSTNETGFKIERRLNGTIQFVLVGTVNADVTGFIDTALTSNTSYEYRVYSYNSIGASLQYSNVVILTTFALNNLQCITIGNQSWTLKNLDVTTYRNGDPIPHVTDETAWANLTTGAWCYNNNDSVNGGKYGKLYNWYAVNDSRGIAPTGYHMSSDAEWTTLVNYLGGELIAGGALKERGTSHWVDSVGSTNSSGFTALPGGFRDYDGTFRSLNQGGFWWTNTEWSSTLSWYRFLSYDAVRVTRMYLDKTDGFSVRLIKD